MNGSSIHRRAGAFEFVEKPASNAKLLAAIDYALAHAATVAKNSELRTIAARRVTGLARRQRQILDFIIEGVSNKEIAAQLRINQRTVESRRAFVMTRIGASSLAGLVRLASAAR